MASPAVTVFLKDEKLRQLAEVIRNHEVNNMYHITFQSVGDQLLYLRMCNDNMASVNTILDECSAESVKFKGDGVRGPIADQIIGYMEHCLNNALQIYRNYTMRRSYLDKMVDHLHQLFKALEELDASSRDAVADLVDTIQKSDQTVMAYMRLSLNPYASAEFSRYLRNVGVGLNELVSSYQVNLGYAGRFEDLEEEQKLDVYVAIMEASGRLSVLGKHEGDVIKGSSSKKSYGGAMATAGKYGSRAMFMKDVGLLVWDVYTADHPITTALRDALVLAAKEGGATIGRLVGVAVATEFLAGVGAPTLVFTAVGLATGFVGGFILGAAAGALFDLIISSAGERPFPTDGIVFYVAPMPNGHDLAKQMV